MISITSCSDPPPLSSTSLASQSIYAASIANQQPYVLIASIQHGASLWNISSEERLYNWNHSENDFTLMSHVSLSTDASIALTADQQRFTLWSTQSGKAIGFWNTDSDIVATDLLHNGSLALIGLNNLTAQLIHSAKGSVITTMHFPDRVRSLALAQASPINKDQQSPWLALTGSDDKAASLWALPQGDLIQQRRFPNIINHVDISTTGEWLFVSCQHNGWSLWRRNNPLSQSPDINISNRTMTVTATQFSASESELLVGGSTRQIELWDLNKKKRIATWSTPKQNSWKPHGSRIMDVGFDQNKGLIYAITSTGTLHQWANPLAEKPTHP